MPRLGLLIDLEKCYGCDACRAACQNEHLWPDDVPFNQVVKEPDSTPDRLTVPLLCMHCDNPGCLAHCEFDALSIDDGGIVMVDSSKCTGCGACAKACPYGAMATTRTVDDGRLRSLMTPVQRALSTQWDLRRKKKIPTKCDLCANRRKAGRPPACVAICPTSAFTVGDLDDATSDLCRLIDDPQVVSMGASDSSTPRVFFRLPESVDVSRLRRLLKTGKVGAMDGS